MKRKSIGILFLFLILAAGPPVKIEKYQFRELLFDLNNFSSSIEIHLEGKTKKSLLSLNDYLYFEIISFNKDRSYTIEYIYENSFTLLWKSYSIDVNYRNIRTFLEPEYSEKINTSTYFREIREYGLISGKKYYLLPHIDTYYITDQNGEIIEKTNTVFYISDRPFNKTIPNVPLSPAFQGWTY